MIPVPDQEHPRPARPMLVQAWRCSDHGCRSCGGGEQFWGWSCRICGRAHRQGGWRTPAEANDAALEHYDRDHAAGTVRVDRYTDPNRFVIRGTRGPGLEWDSDRGSLYVRQKVDAVEVHRHVVEAFIAEWEAYEGRRDNSRGATS